MTFTAIPTTVLRLARPRQTPGAEELEAERQRVTARADDRARDCACFEPMLGAPWGHCNATPLHAGAGPLSACPQTCPCFRRRP
jgi:hypothetical protein